jgi:hypothetical protein
LQTPLRLIFHPSAEKHVAAMATLNVVVKHSAKVQRSRSRDIFVGQQLAERHRFYVRWMVLAVIEPLSN